MYSYRCYGLIIHSTVHLPELDPAEGEADVVICEDEVPYPPSWDFEDDRYFRGVPGEALLAWRGIAKFVVREGREIVFQLLGELEASWLRQFLLGPVLGVLLHQRGLFVLHASAVGVNGHAFVIVGWKGQGKSTTAAGLHQRGHELLADDIVAIDMTDPQEPHVLPGISQLKLWPDTVAALRIDPNNLSLLNSRIQKRAQRISSGSVPSPRPLAGLYVLGQAEEHAIERFPLAEAFSATIQHAYAARFIGKAGIPSWHFYQCVALTRAIPINHFKRKFSLALLPEALDKLEAHFERMSLDFNSSSIGLKE